ncbi:MAG TPA: primosomal protein N' [Steroidobacteraceae bacterium]|nr:primosomal protein N' [Steroidobacteraceae bacterium]
MRPGSKFLRVAVETPLRRLFDYLPAVTPGGAPEPEPGTRVRVPFGRRRLVGVVMAVSDKSELPAERLRPLLEVLDPAPVLDASALELIRWAAEYYHHPVGQVLSSALPKLLRLGAATAATEERWTATEAGREAAAAGEPRRAVKQRALLEFVMSRGGDAAAGCLSEHSASWRDAVRALEKRGWLARAEVAVAEAAEPRRAVAAGPTLLPEQRDAVERVAGASGAFAAFLLQGVTGSGKTEVYLRLTEETLAQGRTVLVLVPEIGLTPQLVGRFRERFAAPLAVLHSALTDQERLGAWRAAWSGHARIVLGTRSAVFAPLADLGLIVVDEEHDASFKQHEGALRYSARDLAVVRARLARVPVLLGSATPSLETLHNVDSGRYTRLRLLRRPGESQPPLLKLIDLRTSAIESGISTLAALAIERHLGADGQVLVFLNRRGFAPTLLCTACGWIAPCSECDARLTVHLAAARLRCHHCGADAPLPPRCRQCGFAVKAVGQGTERIEAVLAARFPGVSIARLDRDVVRRRGDLDEVVRRMSSGEARILVGTQMVTKGHDFPNVTLVVVLNADQGLFSADYRAPERLAQTVVQVAGRAGRGSKPGEVLIQTEFPQHPLLVSLLAHGYDGFAQAALAERQQAAWPPFSRLAALRASGKTRETALGFLSEARAAAGAPPPGLRLLGPVPAAMAKRAGRYHAQLLIESRERPPLHQFLDSWLPGLEAQKSAQRVRWALDVDPLELF